MAVGHAKVTLTRLSYVVYQHPDLETFRSFAKDFGLEEAQHDAEKGVSLFRGYGKDRYVYIALQGPAGSDKAFIGSGFCLESEKNLERAMQIPGAEAVDITNRPGGGRMVRMTDPNGFHVEVYHGQEEQVTPTSGISVVKGGRPVVNGALDKQRKGVFTRMERSPALIHKLGHFGYETNNYEHTCDWYATNFNFKPTDVLYAPGNESQDVATFFHLDLGKQYVDHHCLLVVRSEGPATNVHHSSFEVEDLDTQFMGHQWLLDAGHQLVWGIGRHVHGSQVFDYWYDSSKFIVEHYADGDLVNEDTGILRAEAGNMAVWGPPVPAIWGGKQIGA